MKFFRGNGEGGMMKLLIFLADQCKMDYFLESFLNILMLFLKIKLQNWNIFERC